MDFDNNISEYFSKNLRDISYEISGIKKRTDGIISEISSCWNDTAAEKFYIAYDKLSSNIYRTLMCIDELEEKISIISKTAVDKGYHQPEHDEHELSDVENPDNR